MLNHPEHMIELSADGPIREPYEAYVQGGLTYEHVKLAVTRAVTQLKEQGHNNIIFITWHITRLWAKMCIDWRCMLDTLTK
jgi:hypothetical protein